MLDLLLLPAALLLPLALRAVRRGDHRLHGYLMTAAFTLIGLRLVLHPRELYTHHRIIWLFTLTVAASTIFLGRSALAWREARGSGTAAPRIHRAFGAATLVTLAFATVVWLMRNRT
jgi:hypothetical protein